MSHRDIIWTMRSAGRRIEEILYGGFAMRIISVLPFSCSAPACSFAQLLGGFFQSLHGF